MIPLFIALGNIASSGVTDNLDDHRSDGCDRCRAGAADRPPEQAHDRADNRAEFRPGQIPGLEVLPLHEVASESVALVRWAPGTRLGTHRHQGGEEIFVLNGTFQDENGDYPAGTWIRSPHLSEHAPFSDEGCLIYVKTGHLAEQAA